MTVSTLDSVTRRTMTGLITFYQTRISPHKGFSCAHRVLYGGPSCSQYIKGAIQTHGLMGALPLMQERFEDCSFAHQLLKSRQKGCQHRLHRGPLQIVPALSSRANQSSTNQPSANQPSANQSSTNQSSANQSSANQFSANQFSANQSSANQSSTNQSSENGPLDGFDDVSDVGLEANLLWRDRPSRQTPPNQTPPNGPNNPCLDAACSSPGNVCDGLDCLGDCHALRWHGCDSSGFHCGLSDCGALDCSGLDCSGLDCSGCSALDCGALSCSW